MIQQPKIRIIIADDHAVYLDGLQMVFAAEDDIEVIATAAEGGRLVQLVRQLLPDVVLTDLKMPGYDGLKAIKEIIALGLATHCIILSTYDSEAWIVEALEAGAEGYITKNADKIEIIKAVKTVNSNHPYFCKTSSLNLARQIAKSSFNPYKRSGQPSLNDQEKEIIRMICLEKTSEQISREMFVPKRTVEGIRARIIEKTGVKSPIGLVVYAIQHAIYLIKS